MSFDSLWLSMVENKPLLADPEAKVVISTEQFKELLRKFHANGVKQGQNEQSIFEQVFGSFKQGHR